MTLPRCLSGVEKNHFILSYLINLCSESLTLFCRIRSLRKRKVEVIFFTVTPRTKCGRFSIDHKRSFARLSITADHFAIRHGNRMAKKELADLCRLEFPRVERMFRFVVKLERVAN